MYSLCRESIPPSLSLLSIPSLSFYHHLFQSFSFSNSPILHLFYSPISPIPSNSPNFFYITPLLFICLIFHTSYISLLLNSLIFHIPFISHFFHLPSFYSPNSPTLQLSNSPTLQLSSSPTSDSPTLQLSNSPSLHLSISPSLHLSISLSLFHLYLSKLSLLDN